MTPNPTFRAAREAAIAKKAREIVNAYEDKLRHVRGYYCAAPWRSYRQGNRQLYASGCSAIATRKLPKRPESL